MFAKAIFSLEHYEPKKLGPTEPTALRFTPLRDQFEDAQYMPITCPIYAYYIPNICDVSSNTTSGSLRETQIGLIS